MKLALNFDQWFYRVILSSQQQNYTQVYQDTTDFVWVKIQRKNSFTLFNKLRSVGFGIAVKNKVMTGAYILASRSGYKNLFIKAERIRFLIRNWFVTKFKNFHGLILPTFPIKPLINENSVESYYDTYTIIANLVGLPCIQIPIGMLSNLMPFGFQVIAKPFDEICLFDTCARLQETCGSITLW